MKMLRKLSAVLLFAALTLAVLAAANFLLVVDVHSYSRAMLQELYADAGKIDTLFLGSAHCYRSVDPNAVDAALGTYSFNAGSSQQLPDGSYYMLREAAARGVTLIRISSDIQCPWFGHDSANRPWRCSSAAVCCNGRPITPE